MVIPSIMETPLSPPSSREPPSEKSRGQFVFAELLLHHVHCPIPIAASHSSVVLGCVAMKGVHVERRVERFRLPHCELALVPDGEVAGGIGRTPEPGAIPPLAKRLRR